MKKTKKAAVRFCLFALVAALVFTACPTSEGGGNVPAPDTNDPDALEEAKITGSFTAAPELIFTNAPETYSLSENNIYYKFTPAVYPSTVPDEDVTYNIYIAQQNQSGIRYNKAADVERYNGLTTNTRNSETDYTYNAGHSRVGWWFSAIVIATLPDGSRAVSSVKQSQSLTLITFANPAEETGTLVSRGRSPYPGGRTYYIDRQNGNDNNSGQSPAAAWKTLTRANNTTFTAGTHILLEANSIWNGKPTVLANYVDFAQARGNGGMLAPLGGNGTKDKPIVIDLYRYDPAAKKVYFSADKRPVINGNGTPSLDSSSPYNNTGAVYIQGLHYWHIRNIEVTNTYQDFLTVKDHWYNRTVHKPLTGIYAPGTDRAPRCEGLLIENCYAHDVQSLHSNNGNNTGLYTSREFGGSSTGTKGCGGIIFCVTESTIRGNIVRRVGLEGLRTDHGDSGYNVKIIGNYIDTVAGDGIVISRNKRRPGDGWNLVESNIIKDVCSAPTTYGGNYAGCWNYYSEDTLFQYNEVYGIIYGYNDGEAYDIDIGSTRTVYQYNYSHHNAGGALLIMGTSNGVYRYNISANDGASSRYMKTLKDDAYAPANALDVLSSYNGTSLASWTTWNNGQAIFHYTYEGTSASTQVPLIYNNTFYIGPDVGNMGVFGHNTTNAINKYVRFYNNILLKVGNTGTLYLSYGQQTNGNPNGRISNPDTGFRNNLVWASESGDIQDTTGNISRISNGTGGLSTQELVTTNGNQWKNPKLKIQEAGQWEIFRRSRDTVFPEGDYTDPAKLEQFTSKERVRARASLFMPTDVTGLDFGMVIPGTANTSINNAWNDGFEAMDKSGTTPLDFFGEPITNPPVVGASNKAFDPVKYNPGQYN